MPRLEGANADGYVEAQRTATGLWLFEESWLEQETGTVEGHYRYVWAFCILPHIVCVFLGLFLVFLLPPRVGSLSLPLAVTVAILVFDLSALFARVANAYAR